MVTVVNRPNNFGAEAGKIVGGGIRSLIEEKINDLKTRQGIVDRKATYKKAELPEWLAELPEDKQDLLLKEYDLAPAFQKEQMKELMKTMDSSYFQPDQEEGNISGMNNIAQSGDGFARQQGVGGAQTQAFPQEGHGTTGGASPYAQEGGLRRKGGGKDEALEFRKEQQHFTEQQAIRPFLHAEREDFKAKSNAADIADRMLKNLRKNRKKWPGLIEGNLPEAAQRLLLRDPDVRKYIADANSLVSALAGTRKGVPTNFKLKLEALSKADLSQPIEAQEEILKDVSKSRKKSEKIQDFISSTKDGKSGRYPIDIEQRVSDYERSLSAKNAPDVPEGAQNGDVYEDDDGNKWSYQNGEMVEV